MTRLIKNWNLTRILSLLIGLLVAVQSIMAREWLGLIPSVYLLAMGIFAIGCAGNSCDSCVNIPQDSNKNRE